MTRAVHAARVESGASARPRPVRRLRADRRPSLRHRRGGTAWHGRIDRGSAPRAREIMRTTLLKDPETPRADREAATDARNGARHGTGHRASAPRPSERTAAIAGRSSMTVSALTRPGERDRSDRQAVRGRLVVCPGVVPDRRRRISDAVLHSRIFLDPLGRGARHAGSESVWCMLICAGAMVDHACLVCAGLPDLWR